MIYHLIYPPWSIATDIEGQTFASAPLIPGPDGKYYAFDWEILIDLTARQLIADPLEHPRWLGAMRSHRYPLYTPNSRFVRNAANYLGRRSIPIPVRQIIIAMHLNIHHTHIPKVRVAPSCFEHWCVTLNHIVPFKTLPSSEWHIDYTDPASGRPDVLVPAWEERDLEYRAKQGIANQKARQAALSIGIDPKLLGIPARSDEDDSTD
jgi:hypothetical protein